MLKLPFCCLAWKIHIIHPITFCWTNEISLLCSNGKDCIWLDRELNQTRRQQWERQKAIGLDIKQKNNFEGPLCFFLHFFAIVEQPRCETT